MYQYLPGLTAGFQYFTTANPVIRHMILQISNPRMTDSKNCFSFFFQFSFHDKPNLIIYRLTAIMALRTVLNLTGSSQWRPIASEMLHILNMNRVQDAVVCESLNELLRNLRNYEQQVIIWPSLPGPRIPTLSPECTSNTQFINKYTPYQAWQVYIPEPKLRANNGIALVWPLNGTLEEKTAWLDRLVRFSRV